VNSGQRAAGFICYNHKHVFVRAIAALLLVAACITSIRFQFGSCALQSQKQLHTAPPRPVPDEAHNSLNDVWKFHYRKESSPT
jgi:hypothetical protein